MKYIFYNIRNLAKHEKFIFAIMLVCVFVSAWIMTFSYGLYQNYFSLRAETETEGKELSTELIEGETLTKADVVRYFAAISEETLNAMDLIALWGWTNQGIPVSKTGYGWGQFFFRFTIWDGRYKVSDYVRELWENNNQIISGRYLSDEEEATGADAAMIADDIMKLFDEIDRFAALGEELPTTYGNMEFIELTDATREELTVFGKRYKIVGTVKSGAMVTIPFLSVPDDYELTTAPHFVFRNNITKRQYTELRDKANEVLPGKISFPELDIPDEESIYLYNNIMLISALIAVLTIINFSFLYNFIFRKRRRQLAVMRICGCTKMRALWIYMGECGLICIPTFLLGIAVYIPFMHGVLSKLFVYMEDSYSPQIYIAIFGIYVVILFIIMGAMLLRQIKRETVQIWKGGDN